MRLKRHVFLAINHTFKFLVDTKNTTYLSPYGISILEQKPYNDLKIIVNKNAIIQPSKERYRKLSDVPDITHGDKENCEYIHGFYSLQYGTFRLFLVTSEIADDSTNIEQNLEHGVSNSKRRRELTGKAKEYKEQKSKSKKKNN